MSSPVLAAVSVCSILNDKPLTSSQLFGTFAQSPECESSSCISVFTSTMKPNENRADVPRLVSPAEHKPHANPPSPSFLPLRPTLNLKCKDCSLHFKQIVIFPWKQATDRWLNRTVTLWSRKSQNCSASLCKLKALFSQWEFIVSSLQENWDLIYTSRYFTVV